MADFKPGQTVVIPCDVKSGAFPGEFLITFDTVDGPVSGFVNQDKILNVKDDKGYIKGAVEAVSDDTVTVWVRGSFFTTTGLAYLSHEWARSNLRVA
jgi:hypothetical protein